MRFLFAYGYSTGATPYYYERALKEVAEVITCGPSSDRGKKHDIPCSKNADILPIIKNTKPDYFLLFPEANLFLPDNIEKITIPKILLLSDIFLNFNWQKYYAQLFDIVFVAQREYVEKLKEKGVNAYWLPHACDPKIHRDFHLPRTYDISFVGTLNYWHNPQRSFYLNNLQKHFKLEIFTNAWFEEAAKIYSQSKIVFNISRDKDLGARYFEAMSCGSLLLTDLLGKNLNNLFVPGTHFVAYSSMAEAIKLTDYYLKENKKRETIAKRGQKEVLKKHTYLNRVRFMLQIISKYSFYSHSYSSKFDNLYKTYLYLNNPLFGLAKARKRHSFSLEGLICRLHVKLRIKVVSILTRMNWVWINRIIRWGYYLFRLKLEQVMTK